jgi:hypothetical protein
VGGLLIRYEDLDNPADVERLSKYLGWPVSRSSTLQRRDIGDSRGTPANLSWPDRAILDFVTRKTQKTVGY